MNKRATLLISIVFVSLFACGIYSFKGSLAPHLKTVAIPLFDNRTAEFGVTEEMTDTMIEKFTQDGSLKLMDQTSADVLLEGTISRISDRAGAFDANERVQDLNIYVTVQIKCTDLVKRQIMWEERMTQFGSYDPAEGPDARLDGISEAIEKISKEVLNKTVSGW
jgi:hypothetical protein